MAYNGSHYESLETLSPDDDKKAIELVNLVKTNGYTLKKIHIAAMARVSQSKKTEICTTKETVGKAKVKKGEYNNLLHKFKCTKCDVSFDTKMDMTFHNLLEHKQGFCIICNAEKWGDNKLNDDTKICRANRDKERAEDDKKDIERANKNPIKPTNIYTILMDEGVKTRKRKWRK